MEEGEWWGEGRWKKVMGGLEEGWLDGNVVACG